MQPSGAQLKHQAYRPRSRVIKDLFESFWTLFIHYSTPRAAIDGVNNDDIF